MSGSETSGVRAELAVRDPDGCPVATASTDVDAPAGAVAWTSSPSAETITEQFVVEGGAEPPEEFDAVFERGDGRVYQFERDPGQDCVCEFVESLSCPVADVEAADGALHLTLHLADLDRLRTVVSRLRDRYDGVSVRYLAQAGDDTTGEEIVPVALGRLTDRQREALETAHRMGYFEYPRDANASEVAEALDIGSSTLIEHLTAAQRKLMDELLSDPASPGPRGRETR